MEQQHRLCLAAHITGSTLPAFIIDIVLSLLFERSQFFAISGDLGLPD